MAEIDIDALIDENSIAEEVPADNQTQLQEAVVDSSQEVDVDELISSSSDSEFDDMKFLESIGVVDTPKVMSATNPKGMQSGQPKTTSMFAGAYSRLLELTGNLAQGIARVNKNDTQAEKIIKAVRNPAPLFLEVTNKLNPFEGNKELESIFKMLEGDSNALEGFKEEINAGLEEIGYGREVPWAEIKNDWKEGNLGLKKFFTFVLERFVTSIPDMASVVSGATIPPYVVSLSNENLNARLKNDNKTLDEATAGDLSASIGSAIFQAVTEKFAVDFLLGKGGFKAKNNLAESTENIVKQAGVQGTQEVVAEGVTYAGQTVGTEKGFDKDEFTDVILESLVSSAPIGGTIQTVRETGGAVLSDSSYTLLPQKETPTVGNVQDTTVKQPVDTLTDQDAEVNEQLDMQLQDVEQESINEGLDSRSVELKVYEDDIFDDATDQLNREFQLSEDETVVLNKVNYSPKMAKIQNAIKDVFDVDLVFVNFSSDQSIVTNIGRKLGKFNGFRIEGRDAIVIDEKAFDFNNVLGHELTHVLETRMPEEFQTLLDVAKRRIPEERQQQFRQELGQAIDNRSGDVDSTLFDSELVAEMVGEQSSDVTFWQEVYAGMENKTVARQLYDAVNDFYKKILQKLQGSEFITERQGIIEARKSSARAFQNFAKGRLNENRQQARQDTIVGSVSDDSQVLEQTSTNLSDSQQVIPDKQEEELNQGESSNTELDGVPTVEVPLNELVLEGTVKQFKSGANKRGIVTPLVADKYERVGTPPIIVWQRLNGTKCYV